MSGTVFKRGSRNAGKYRRKFTLLKNTSTHTAQQTGQNTDVFVEEGEHRCFFEEISGDEYFGGFLVVDKQNYYMECKYIPLLNNRDRIKIKRRDGVVLILDITEVVDDKDEGRYMRLMLSSELADAVTNISTAPKVVTNIITDANRNTIQVKFDREIQVTDLNKNLDKFIVLSNGKQVSVTSYKIYQNPADKIDLIFATDFSHSDSIFWNYAGGDFVTGVLRNTPLSKMKIKVTNKILGTNPIPVNPHVISSYIDKNKPNVITVTYNEPMKADTTELIKAINTLIAGGNNVPFNPTAIAFRTDKAILDFTYATPFSYGDIVSWAYNDAHPTSNLSNIAGVEAENQSYAVHNSIDKPISIVTPARAISATIEDSNKKQIIVRFDSDIKRGAGVNTDYFKHDGTMFLSYHIIDARNVALNTSKDFTYNQVIHVMNDLSIPVIQRPIISSNDIAIPQFNLLVTNNILKPVITAPKVLLHEDFTAMKDDFFDIYKDTFSQSTDHVGIIKGIFKKSINNLTPQFELDFNIYFSPNILGKGFKIGLIGTKQGGYFVGVENESLYIGLDDGSNVSYEKTITKPVFDIAGSKQILLADGKVHLKMICTHTTLRVILKYDDTKLSILNRDITVNSPMPLDMSFVNALRLTFDAGTYKLYDLKITEIKP